MLAVHVRSFAASLAAAIWPLDDLCALCGRGKPVTLLFDAPVCLSCLTLALWQPGRPCVRCGRPLPGSAYPRLCPTCRSAELGTDTAAPLDRSMALGIYQGNLARHLRRLKYDGQARLGEPLGHLLGVALASRLGPPPEDSGGWRAAVVPVPLHPARYAERGYNQAALIAAGVADVLNLPLLTHALARVRGGAAQAGLDRTARLKALTGAFSCRAHGGGTGSTARTIQGKDILLVDDVLTTGATLAACATALRQAGARRVFGCVVAIGINRQWWGPALRALEDPFWRHGTGAVGGLVNDIPRDINRR